MRSDRLKKVLIQIYEVEIIKEKYSDEYVQEVIDRISQGLDDIQNKEYRTILRSPPTKVLNMKAHPSGSFIFKDFP